ncbi:type II secretion system protein C (GspC) [Alteromonadaceae bacterium Bs31]|nr:type II secretion system protein C (GspC) [Alteromonadaceae bacterium Bs31]
MTTQLADNPMLVRAEEQGRKALAYLKTLPLDFWRNGLLFLAALWICHSLAALFWLVFPVPDVPQPANLAAPVAAQSATGAPKGAQVDVAALQAIHVFGEAGEIPPESIPEEQAAANTDDIGEVNQTTKLPLQLHGVIASEEQQHARAIIEGGNEQKLYRVGEEIKKHKGVKLVKVEEQRAILDNKGTLESLWLYSEEDFKKSSSSRNRHKVSRGSSKDPSSTLKAPVKNIKANQIPKTISDVVRFSVHREDGQMVGYKVRPGRDRELFEQVGLQAGDIVTNVNGREMNDPKQLREVYQELKTATEANLGVRRGSEEMQITIRVDNTGG